MTIHEPSTLLSDLFLAAVTASLAEGLRREAVRTRQRSIGMWAAALAAAALAALTGGLYHGFGHELGARGQAALWNATTLSAGAASALMLTGTGIATLPRLAARLVGGFALLKLAGYSAWIVRYPDFRSVAIDQAATMLVVLALLGSRRQRMPAGAFSPIAGGIVVSFAGATVQQLGLAPHEHFNHNDLFHVIQAGANLLLFRGARRLHDWTLREEPLGRGT